MKVNLKSLEDNVCQILEQIQQLSSHGEVETYLITQAQKALQKELDRQIKALRGMAKRKPINFFFRLQ